MVVGVGLITSLEEWIVVRARSAVEGNNSQSCGVETLEIPDRCTSRHLPLPRSAHPGLSTTPLTLHSFLCLRLYASSEVLLMS